MRHTRKPKSIKSQKYYPWRKIKDKWTDTLFSVRLLKNPALMTNQELARALSEHLEYRTSKGKYDWQYDPIEEHKESESPFSARVVSRLLIEAIARLQIVGDLTMGRLKRDAE